MLLRRTWNPLIVTGWGREGQQGSGFSIPALQDPPWFHLLFCPWVTIFLPLFISRANSLASFDTLLVSVYLFPFSGIWEPSLRGKGAMTTLDSSGFTGASWGSGVPLSALCQDAFMEGDKSLWNDKVWLVSALYRCWSGNILVILPIGDLLYSRRNKFNKKLKVHGPKINRSRKAAQGLARRTRNRHWLVILLFL